MRSKKLFLGLGSALVGLAVSACSGAAPEKAAYITELNIFQNKESVRLMQVTDIHWHAGTDMVEQVNYLNKLVELVNPDIIVSTGDNFLGGNMDDINTLFGWFNSLKKADGTPIYWTSTWGNHDRSGIYNPDYLSDLLLGSSKHHSYTYGNEYESYGLYKDPRDDVHGRGNSVINLTDGTKTIWQLYCVDSNSDWYNGSYYDYDCIHEDEVEWFKEVAKYTREKEGRPSIPSILYEHIPLFQVGYAYKEVKDNALDKVTYSWGEVRESPNDGDFAKAWDNYGIYSGYKDTGMFQAAKENGVQGIFCGHDHINDFYAQYDGVYIGYGQKTGNQLYYNTNCIGAKYIDLHKNTPVFDGRMGYDMHVQLLDYAGNQSLDQEVPA